MKRLLHYALIVVFAWCCCSVLLVEGARKKRKQIITEAAATFDLGEEGITGVITFTQACGGVKVNVQLVGLNQKIGEWDIHQNPISKKPGEAYCATVGAAFVGKNNARIGSLSERLGSFALENNVLDRTYLDDSISLNGGYSIVGKSLVLHSAAEGQPKLVCVNIEAKKFTRG